MPPGSGTRTDEGTEVLGLGGADPRHGSGPPSLIFLPERPVRRPKPVRLGETLAGDRTPPYNVAPLPLSRAPVPPVDEPKSQGIGDEGYPPRAVPSGGQGEGEVGLQVEARPDEEARSQEETGEEAASEEEAGLKVKAHSQEETGEEAVSEEEAGLKVKAHSQEETGEEVASEEEAC